MPKFHAAVRKDVVGPKATLPSMEEAVKEIDKAVKKAIKKGTSAKPKKRQEELTGENSSGLNVINRSCTRLRGCSYVRPIFFAVLRRALVVPLSS
jgi:hypothetical protein